MVMWNRASTKLRRTCKRWFSSESTRRTYAALWGNGDFGRLGLGNLDSQWRPRLLPSSAFGNQGLNSIACGGAHTLFLTGSLFSFKPWFFFRSRLFKFQFFRKKKNSYQGAIAGVLFISSSNPGWSSTNQRKILLEFN